MFILITLSINVLLITVHCKVTEACYIINIIDRMYFATDGVHTFVSVPATLQMLLMIFSLQDSSWQNQHVIRNLIIVGSVRECVFNK